MAEVCKRSAIFCVFITKKNNLKFISFIINDDFDIKCYIASIIC